MVGTRLKGDAMAGGKREDPNYQQISGFIPKDLALKFKSQATLREKTLSVAIEEAVKKWLEEVQVESK